MIIFTEDNNNIVCFCNTNKYLITLKIKSHLYNLKYLLVYSN